MCACANPGADGRTADGCTETHYSPGKFFVSGQFGSGVVGFFVGGPCRDYGPGSFRFLGQQRGKRSHRDASQDWATN